MMVGESSQHGTATFISLFLRLFEHRIADDAEARARFCAGRLDVINGA
jgi:hypothetical protein